MSAKKIRKRAYIPPSNEVQNRKERVVSKTERRPSNNSRANFVPPTPSIKRTAKRLPIYFVMVLALQFYLLNRAEPSRSNLDLLLFAGAQSAIVTLVLAPFMHLMDKTAYNRWLKRQTASKAK